MLTSTHWGVYDVTVKDGVITGVTPFDRDLDPSPIGNSLPGAVAGPMRVRHPAVRKSYLEGGAGAASEKRGAEAFVNVSWNEAFDLVAAELKRVITQFGNSAIFAGSYGWASAGRRHEFQRHRQGLECHAEDAAGCAAGRHPQCRPELQPEWGRV